MLTDNQVSLKEKPTKLYFKNWYELNKEKLSLERKRKYKEDPEYKNKLKIQSEAYRKQKPKLPRKKTERMTIQLLCDAAGCSIHTYRKYCILKWIPILDQRIVFTELHVKLLKDLYTAAIESKYMKHNRQEFLNPYISALKEGWNTKDIT